MNGFALGREVTGQAAGSLSGTGFDIKRSANHPGSYDLTLNGFLMPGWAGRLMVGLAQHRVSIVRGEAEKVTVSSWSSHFLVQGAPFAGDPFNLDYLALANTELPQERERGRISLLDFALEPCSSHDGSLYLEVRGADRLGFLGDLLDYFSMRCLFPVKMTIETVGNTALDRFWLKGFGGSRPSDSIAKAINENLQKLLADRS